MSTYRSKLLLALTILLPTLAAAQPLLSNTLGFSARIADGGQPVTGSRDFAFTLFDADTAGASLWTESQTLTVNDGVVVAALGATTTLPAFDGSNRWLEVSMGGVPFSPRMAVRAVPYAMRAAVANTATNATTATTATSMNVALTCVIAAGTEYSIAAAGRCPNRTPLCPFCLIGQYCPCDECMSGTCPAGYTVTGGGYWAGNSTTDFNVMSSIPFGSDRWKLRVFNNSAGALLLTPYAQCCKVP